MKFHWVILAANLLFWCFAGNSMATTISYAESYNPGPNFLMNVNGTGQHKIHNWVFDVRDNAGWNTPGQVFGTGLISLVVQDDGGPGDGVEKATFTFEVGTGLTNANINASDWSGIFSLAASAFNDGLITATLAATTGDFYFKGAELRMESNFADAPINQVAPAPEPSTLILLGAGLGGLVLRRKTRNT